jgi:hypothetical protein
MAGVAVQQQPLATGIVLSGFSGTPVVTPTGEVAFLATRAMPGADPSAPPRSLGAAILAGNGQGLELVVARDMPAPGGGTFKTLGQPAINAAGTIAFRGAVQSAFTRTSGLFVRFPTGLVPFLLRGEATPVGGRFDTFAAQVATNSLDDLAFDASVSGGQANNALFVASPTVLRARPVVLRLTNGRGHDTVALRATLQPGRVSDGVDPANEPVTLTLRDADGVLWTATLAPKRLTARGRSFILHVAKHDRATTPVRALRVDVLGRGGVRFTATSKNVDLTQGGTRTLTPPFTISCEVGDDSGMATIVPRVIRVGRRR